LSSWVRSLRRRSQHVEGAISWRDGTRQEIDVSTLVAPAETALRLLVAAHVLLALALIARHV